MGQGHPACQGYPGYHGYHPGMGDCPYAKGPAQVAPMTGKSLGVYISDLPNAMLDAAEVGYGVNVEKVRPDSAAAAAGIRAGDLITEFAGKPVLSGERLRWLVRKAESDKPLEVKLMREGKSVTVSVTLQAPMAKPRCDSQETPKVGT
jgi:S1-C subfamily serine protease